MNIIKSITKKGEKLSYSQSVLSKRVSPNQDNSVDLLNQASLANPVGFLNPLNPISPLSVYQEVTTNSCDSSSSSSCSDF